MPLNNEAVRRAEIQKDFLRDVQHHTMRVLHEDGVYRHLSFTNNGSSVYRFDLVTYPGFLVYSGDMGCFVFQRLHDMLEFFRSDRVNGEELSINCGYWAEKLQAVDGQRHRGSATEFDPDKFRAVVNQQRIQWMRDAKYDNMLDKAQRRQLWEAVDDDVLRHVAELHDDGDRAMYAAYDFVWRPDLDYSRNGWGFCDLWEHDFTRYTSTFLWCCYALAWGIKQYDIAKAARPA